MLVAVKELAPRIFLKHALNVEIVFVHLRKVDRGLANLFLNSVEQIWGLWVILSTRHPFRIQISRFLNKSFVRGELSSLLPRHDDHR